MRKVAIFLENKKWSDGWAGYIYANNELNGDKFEYHKDSTDQWGNEVKVYKTNKPLTLDTPSGAVTSDYVVLV